MANKQDPLARLMRFIDVRGGDECWPWIGGMGSWGYGSFWLNGGNINASRGVYILLVGDPGDLVVCHRCDNPACCNPGHLFAGTQGDNVRDCRAKNRHNGHFMTETHPRYSAKLNESKVKKARKLYASGIPQAAIARRFGVDRSTMSRAIRGKVWGHVK